MGRFIVLKHILAITIVSLYNNLLASVTCDTSYRKRFHLIRLYACVSATFCK